MHRDTQTQKHASSAGGAKNGRWPLLEAPPTAVMPAVVEGMADDDVDNVFRRSCLRTFSPEYEHMRKRPSPPLLTTHLCFNNAYRTTMRWRRGVFFSRAGNHVRGNAYCGFPGTGVREKQHQIHGIRHVWAVSVSHAVGTLFLVSGLPRTHFVRTLDCICIVLALSREMPLKY